MLEQLASPENVLALRAVGTVDRSDYENVLEPAVDAMLATHGEMRFVYVIGDEFEKYSAGADWEDMKFGFTHLSKWKKCAIVTDKDWIRHGIRLFRWMMPGELEVFDPADVQAAIDWAAA
jgi:hypothetical protein